MFKARIVPAYDPQSVLTKVDFDDDDLCWEWNGNIDQYGYGTYGRQCYMVHRVVYEILVGEIGTDMTVDHLCSNRSCVNPNHLEAVSLAENVLRGGNPYAVNARKTHCHLGHEFDDKNTYIHPKRGHRQCKTCRRIAMDNYLIRKRG